MPTSVPGALLPTELGGTRRVVSSIGFIRLEEGVGLTFFGIWVAQ
jgi:hypothetical protein